MGENSSETYNGIVTRGNTKLYQYIYQCYIKRFIDLIGASLLLIVLLPLFLVVALVIKLTSMGPIFYKQPRHTTKQHIFTIFKFRTMYIEHCVINGGGKQAEQNDARITKIGRLLRRTSIDELPQLLNVLRGDMSLIGPRPHPVDLNYFYEQQIPEYWKRHRVKPGITGWAQVNGLRGETRETSVMEERLKYDIYYTENVSLWLDIKIAFLTVREVLFPRNAH